MAEHKNVELEIAKCFESPTNPRGIVFDKAAQTELVASIKEKGVLMPVLARPSKGGKYEIIAGNRRLRAAKEAGLAWIPARVVEMTDTEVREAQIVENLQRADISPIDEALAYEELKLEAEAIAAKVGKSASYIRLRLGLLNLDKKYVAKMREGVLPVAHAQLIARLDKDDQEAAFDVAIDRWNGSVNSLSDLKEHIRNVSFKAAMKSPPWADDEAAKAEIARATGITGGGKTLFGEKAADSFDDPKQYALALAAYLKITQDKYAADGKKLSLVVQNHFMPTDLARSVLKEGRYKLVSDVKGCKSGHDGLIVEGGKAGKIIRICTDKRCPAHYPPEHKARTHQAGETEEQKQKREAKEAAKQAKENAAFAEAIGRVKAPLTDEQIDVLFGATFDKSSWERDFIAERFGLTPKVTKRSWGDEADYDDALMAHFGQSQARKLQFIFAIALRDNWLDSKFKKLLKRL